MKNMMVLMVCLLGAFSSVAQNANVISVQGNAEFFEVPEMMCVDISVSSKAESYGKAAEDLMLNYKEAERVFEQEGIKKDLLKSSAISVSENYTWSDNERKPDGYVGNMSVRLKVPYTVDMMNRVMQALKAEELKSGYRLRFELSEKQKEAILKHVIDEAVKDAKIKAGYLADALGVKLARVVSVNFDANQTNTGTFFVRGANELNSMSAKAADFELTPQELSVQKTVDVVWSIK
ncbi:MAG: SIMPL domain-containing protein [Mangrovibacterium sp.]